MFKAIVFACLINSSDQCLELSDLWGLRATKAECEVRISEMKVSVEQVMPQYTIVGTKCEKIGDLI